MSALKRPFVHYVANNASKAFAHYHGLREALPDLRGVALLDEFRGEQSHPGLQTLAWERREIENYLSSRRTLEAYTESTARQDALGPLFEESEVQRRSAAMREAIDEIEGARVSLGKGSPWDSHTKVRDDFLSPLFEAYFKGLDMPNLMRKKSFYELADFVPEDEIPPEVTEKLDAIASADAAATPRS